MASAGTQRGGDRYTVCDTKAEEFVRQPIGLTAFFAERAVFSHCGQEKRPARQVGLAGRLLFLILSRSYFRRRRGYGKTAEIQLTFRQLNAII